jgi:hypothetical protein
MPCWVGFRWLTPPANFHRPSGTIPLSAGQGRFFALFALFVITLLISPLRAADVPTVGIEGQLTVLLPGPELKTKPPDRASPLNLRIASTRPHGSQVQYDLRYIGLVPGRYDLRQYLVRADGAPVGELPELKVEVAGVLPPQHQGQLSPRSDLPELHLGGYRWWMGAAAGLWALLAFPLFLGRRRRPQKTESAPVAPPTLAERMRPLVELATKGQLTGDQQAQLERMLLGHWRERLGLDSLDLSEATTRLRAHPEAGTLLRALEDWLHRPPGSVKVDLDAVLSPYAKPQTQTP